MRQYLLAGAILAFSASAASAVMPPHRKYEGPPKTRAEAMQRMETRLSDVKKMTDAEWTQAMLKSRGERRRPHRDPGAAAPAAAVVQPVKAPKK